MDRERILADLKIIISDCLQGTGIKAYLFGSWARGEERRSSDIDIAIEHDGYLPPLALSELKSIVAESHVPYRVDIVDLASAGELITDKVRKEGILWVG